MKTAQEQVILQDYLNAVRAPISSLVSLLGQQLQSLQQTFDYSHHSMEVIDQQQTDREGEEEDSSPARLKKDFNAEIRKVVGIRRRIEEVLNVYKVEIKGMARTIIDLEEQLALKKKEALQLSRKNKSKEEDLKIRQPPQPLKPNQCPNCSKADQDKNKWKTLSLKIEEFKRKNSSFELQLKHKDSLLQEKEQQVGALRVKVSSLEKGMGGEKEQQERRKLKKENTNLRGEKVLLSNQLSSLRKQLTEKAEISDVQDIEIKKLRLQIENLNSSLNWHINNLNQLRNSQKRGVSHEQREQSERVQELYKVNKVLVKAIEEQQSMLQVLNGKSKKVEEGWGRECEKYERRLSQMESILQDKNETIVKLKTSSKNERQSTYQSDMIKVLNKKLAQKEEVIRSLQEQLHFTQ